MTKEEILEGNKLIAQFLGLTIITDEISLFDTNYKPLAKYHESWNDLMPVVEKIEKTNRYNEYYPDTVTIWKDCCKISDGNNGNELVCVYSGTTKIAAVWLAVVEYIKFYNEKCSK